MSPKELLYIEDALEHELHMQNACRECTNSLQDPQLRTFVSQLESKHRRNYQKLFELLH